jgi:hypothetical protein
MSLVMTVPIEKEAWVAYWLTPLTSDQKPNNTTIQPTIGHHIVESTIDPADLQLYPVIVTGQRFQIKFGKYCNTYHSG